MGLADGDKDSADGDKSLAGWGKSLADYTDYAKAIRRKVVGVSIRMAFA